MDNYYAEGIKRILNKYLVGDHVVIYEDIDVRTLGLDSIAYIQFLAELEEYFDIDFGYDGISTLKCVSILNLSKIISNIRKI